MKASLLFFLFLATSIIAFAQNVANVGAAHGEPGAGDRLIGTWRLVSAGTFRSDGKFEPYPEYGPKCAPPTRPVTQKLPDCQISLPNPSSLFP